MKAYLGNPKLKAFVLAELKRHRANDEIVKGVYWEDGKGCAVGCTLDAIAHFNGNNRDIYRGDHSLYQSELGIPISLAYLQDAIFEGLPEPENIDWPIQFAQAITPGADLSKAWPEFAIILLTDPSGSLWKSTRKNKMARRAIKSVANLYRRLLSGDIPAQRDWEKAEAEARAAAEVAARAAAEAAAWAARAARAAAWAAEAWEARAAAAWAEARKARAEEAVARETARMASDSGKSYQWQRDQLLSILTKAKPEGRESS